MGLGRIIVIVSILRLVRTPSLDEPLLNGHLFVASKVNPPLFSRVHEKSSTSFVSLPLIYRLSW